MRVFGAPALLLLYSATLGAQPASFAGIALNSATGQPLGGVHLKLFTMNLTGAAFEAYGALSGRDGRFSIARIPGGTYILLPERAGFVHMLTAPGAIPLPTVTLKSGETVADYKLEMTPRAVISVRVVDQYGDPVPNVEIEANPAVPGAPIAASVTGANRAFTNVLGEARISGGPGRFRVKASPPSPGNPRREVRTDGTSEPTYGPTWYPSATSADRATAVDVQPGGDVAIELRLVGQRTMTITGTVTGIPEGVTPMVSLRYGDSPNRILSSRGTSVGRTGEFTFSNLPPAFYSLSATASANGRPLQSQTVEFKPDAPEVVTAELALTAGFELIGAVETTGQPRAATTEKRTVTVGVATAPVEPDGSFRIRGVFPVRSRVDVQPLPDTAYIQTVEVDGAATPDASVDLTRIRDGSTVKIVLSRDAAQLSGAVLEKDGQPLRNAVAIVILARDADHVSANPDGLVKDGKYAFKAVRPGKYLLFAVDAFRSGAANTPEDFKRLAAAAEEIEIKAGDHITRDLKVLLKEDVDARVQKK
jgi:hypothetical protein